MWVVFIWFKYLKNSHCLGYSHNFLAFFFCLLVQYTVENNPFPPQGRQETWSCIGAGTEGLGTPLGDEGRMGTVSGA